jgi:hypothetical protein
MAMLLMLYSVVVARVAAAACPDLARMRTARVVEGFDGAKLEGPALWYEHAFIDIAQIGATCQTLGVRYSKSTHDVSMDFRVTYGKLPFTIVEDYAANRSIPGLFTKEAEMPGAGLLKLPTVVVDVGTAPGAGGQYSSMILYSCAMKLGLPIIELVIATRQPTISPPELQALLEVAKQQEIRWKPGELKLVNRARVNPWRHRLPPWIPSSVRPPARLASLSAWCCCRGLRSLLFATSHWPRRSSPP